MRRYLRRETTILPLQRVDLIGPAQEAWADVTALSALISLADWFGERDYTDMTNILFVGAL
jgi:hypothetical protein